MSTTANASPRSSLTILNGKSPFQLEKGLFHLPGDGEATDCCPVGLMLPLTYQTDHPLRRSDPP